MLKYKVCLLFITIFIINEYLSNLSSLFSSKWASNSYMLHVDIDKSRLNYSNQNLAPSSGQE